MSSDRYLRLFPDDAEKRRVFPSPVEPESDGYSVAWKLRYAPDALTDADQKYAASIVSAYHYLICGMTAKDRQSVVSEIRRRLAVRTP
jgi:hypothetical protein